MYDFRTSGTNTVHDYQSEHEIDLEDDIRASFHIALRFWDLLRTINLNHYEQNTQ